MKKQSTTLSCETRSISSILNGVFWVSLSSLKSQWVCRLFNQRKRCIFRYKSRLPTPLSSFHLSLSLFSHSVSLSLFLPPQPLYLPFSPLTLYVPSFFTLRKKRKENFSSYNVEQGPGVLFPYIFQDQNAQCNNSCPQCTDHKYFQLRWKKTRV